MTSPTRMNRVLGFSSILKPHAKVLGIGLFAVLGEGIANLLEPWPLKIILDNVLKTRPLKGWLNRLILSVADDNRPKILEIAAVAVLVIAGIGAICTYTEKYLTTSVGQRVMHDLRRTLYYHIQRLSLAYHDRKQTGDLISRVTSDIDSIQSFVASGLLGVLTSSLTLVGMVGVMFYLNWGFTLIALSVAPMLFLVVYVYTRRIKKAAREVRKKEGEIVSIVQEVLSSIHVVKAFAREDYEQRRLEEESLESVEIALRARGLKAKLARRLYLFREEYIFDLAGAIVVEIPRHGHATYFFAQRRSMAEFLLLYAAVTRADIRKNRENVAERLGFTRRLVHGANPEPGSGI